MSAGGTVPLLPLTTTTTSASTSSTGGNNQLPAGYSSSSSSSMNPSVLTIVLILSATVLLSVSVCLLLRHLNRRCLLHLSSSSSSVSPEDPPTTTTTVAASSFLESLPVFTFASVKRRSSSSEGDCAVCLSKFEGEDRLRLLPLCCHAFHVECIDTWLTSNQTCPLCRSPLFASEISDLLSRRSSSTSFRIEIGSVSRRRPDPAADPSHQRQRSYSMGSSLDYVVDGEYSEVTVDKEEEEEEGRSISWLRDYVERLSSRSWFFTGSSRRSSDRHNHHDYNQEEEEGEGEEVVVVVNDDDDDVIRNYVGDDLEAATRATGDHISEMFRWFSAL